MDDFKGLWWLTSVLRGLSFHPALSSWFLPEYSIGEKKSKKPGYLSLTLAKKREKSAHSPRQASRPSNGAAHLDFSAAISKTNAKINSTVSSPWYQRRGEAACPHVASTCAASLRRTARMLQLRLEPTCRLLPLPLLLGEPSPRARAHTHTHSHRRYVSRAAGREGGSRNASANHAFSRRKECAMASQQACLLRTCFRTC